MNSDCSSGNRTINNRKTEMSLKNLFQQEKIEANFNANPFVLKGCK